MKLFFFRKRSKWFDFLLGIFILLLIIPKTGQPIRIGMNRLKTFVWSPSISNTGERTKISSFDYSLRNLDENIVTQPIGKGKITFLGFWATWCAPCIAELPSIEALFNDYGQDINFVLVTHEPPRVVNDFIMEKGFEVPVYFPASTVPKALQSSSIPTNYLIDSEGVIIIKETGAANWNSENVRE